MIPDENDAITRLASFISIGEEKTYLSQFLPNNKKNLQIKHFPAYEETIKMYDNNDELKEITIRIYGWIGTYRTTRGMKKEINEFSDNYLAIFAHNKMDYEMYYQ